MGPIGAKTADPSGGRSIAMQVRCKEWSTAFTSRCWPRETAGLLVALCAVGCSLLEKSDAQVLLEHLVE